MLSLLLPGLGHVYSGQPGRAAKAGAIALAAGLVLIALMIWLPFGALTLLLVLAGGLALALGIARDAAQTARAAPVDFVLRPYNNWLLYSVLVVAGSYVPELPSSLVEAYRIPSGAMEPTLQIGDFLFVLKGGSHRELVRDRIVVFESVEEPGVMIIKRILGVPGDTLAMEHNVVVRNGSRLAEPYVIETDRLEDPAHAAMLQTQLPHLVGTDPARYKPTLKNWGPLLVSSDSVFVLGDNRDNSYDSRYYGFVGRDRIKGRPLVIYYSYDRNGPPLPFFTAIRSDRIGRRFK